MTTVKVGEVYYDSWGYDQTNIDFVEVVSISPSGKSVLCQMASKKDVQDDHVVPSGKYGVQFRLLVRGNGLVGSYPFVQSSFPNCKLFEVSVSRWQDKAAEFVCIKGLPEVNNYRFWTGDRRRGWCEDCANCYDEPRISFREGGSFVRFEYPVYETPFGEGY